MRRPRGSGAPAQVWFVSLARRTRTSVVTAGFAENDTAYKLFLPAALAFFHRALAAAASFARQAALRFIRRPVRRRGPRTLVEPLGLPRRGLLPDGIAPFSNSASCASSVAMRCFITMARRICFTDRSASEFIAGGDNTGRAVGSRQRRNRPGLPVAAAARWHHCWRAGVSSRHSSRRFLRASVSAVKVSFGDQSALARPVLQCGGAAEPF